jgi:hypothetical protein
MFAQHQQEHFNSSSRTNQVIKKEMINPEHFGIPFETHNQFDSDKIPRNTIQIEKKEESHDFKNPNRSLIIYICSPNNKARKVSVIPDDSVYIVNSVFPGQRKVYFYNGEILDPNHSFNYYGITNGDRIVTVPIEQMNFNTELFWRKATKNCENNQERYTSMNDIQTKRLIAKNNDLILFKAERRVVSKRRIYRNLMFLIEEKCYSNIPTSLPDSPASISEAALPALW